jgi:hypothetical protein
MELPPLNEGEYVRPVKSRGKNYWYVAKKEKREEDGKVVERKVRKLTEEEAMAYKALAEKQPTTPTEAQPTTSAKTTVSPEKTTSELAEAKPEQAETTSKTRHPFAEAEPVHRILEAPEENAPSEATPQEPKPPQPTPVTSPESGPKPSERIALTEQPQSDSKRVETSRSIPEPIPEPEKKAPAPQPLKETRKTEKQVKKETPTKQRVIAEILPKGTPGLKLSPFGYVVEDKKDGFYRLIPTLIGFKEGIVFISVDNEVSCGTCEAEACEHTQALVRCSSRLHND